MTVECKNCKKDFYKYQPLHFTLITKSPYIKCPHCGKKYYINFKER